MVIKANITILGLPRSLIHISVNDLWMEINVIIDIVINPILTIFGFNYVSFSLVYNFHLLTFAENKDFGFIIMIHSLSSYVEQTIKSVD